MRRLQQRSFGPLIRTLRKSRHAADVRSDDKGVAFLRARNDEKARAFCPGWLPATWLMSSSVRLRTCYFRGHHPIDIDAKTPSFTNHRVAMNKGSIEHRGLTPAL